MSQASERTTTINAIMRRPGFQQGLRDFHLGKAIPAGLPQDAEWDYECGRLFAAATGARRER